MKKLIKVTKEDIKQSTPMTGNYMCPVARAISRTVGKPLGYVQVTGNTQGEIRFFKYSFDMPRVNPVHTNKQNERVLQFVKNFDDKKPVVPFNFYIDIPEELY